MKTVHQELLDNERKFGFKIARDLVSAHVKFMRDELGAKPDSKALTEALEISDMLDRFYRYMPGDVNRE